MARSGTISVLKRDGTIEPFDRLKLRGCLLRAMGSRREAYLADVIAAGVECYLRRQRTRCVTSPAVLEMVLAVLGRLEMHPAKAALEGRHAARLRLRDRLTLHHTADTRTAWSKDWLVHQGRSHWHLGRAAARILAGEIEQRLMQRGALEADRQDIIRMLARDVAAWGLTDVEAQPAAVSGGGGARRG